MARVRITYKAIVPDDRPHPEAEEELRVEERILTHEYNLFTAVGACVAELLGNYEAFEVHVNKLEG